MDTSKKYIEMWLASGLEVKPDDYQPWVCPECFEVYSPEEMPLGKWHWCHDEEKVYVPVDLVPLPRQDQLQKMAYPYTTCQGVSCHICWPLVGQLLERFWRFAKDYLDYGKPNLLPDNSISMEQLWLAFVIKTWKEGGRKDGGSSNCTGGSSS